MHLSELSQEFLVSYAVKDAVLILYYKNQIQFRHYSKITLYMMKQPMKASLASKFEKWPLSFYA